VFCHITRTGKARPLMTAGDAVAGIAATVTAQGLKCTAVLGDGHYPGRVKVSGATMKHPEERVLDRDGFHGEWNYTIPPAPRTAPEPEPEPARAGRVPQGTLNHPALTGMAPEDVKTPAAALEAQFEARLQPQYRTRHGHRARAAGSAPHGNRRLDVTDHLLALRLRDYLNLPVQAAGALLGIDHATASHATALARELLTTARITLPDAPPPGKPPAPPASSSPTPPPPESP